MKNGRSQQTLRNSRESSGTTLQTYIQINWKNLEEMNKFLDIYIHLKLNQEDINHPKRSITCNEGEAPKQRVSQKEKSKT
jgi:hypothetical protein